jgi:hypothetical protein
MLIGNAVAMMSPQTFEYDDAAAPMLIMGQVFPKRADAEIVLAAERLKGPRMEYELVEVHQDSGATVPPAKDWTLENNMAVAGEKLIDAITRTGVKSVPAEVLVATEALRAAIEKYNEIPF